MTQKQRQWLKNKWLNNKWQNDESHFSSRVDPFVIGTKGLHSIHTWCICLHVLSCWRKLTEKSSCLIGMFDTSRKLDVTIYHVVDSSRTRFMSSNFESLQLWASITVARQVPWTTTVKSSSRTRICNCVGSKYGYHDSLCQFCCIFWGWLYKETSQTLNVWDICLHVVHVDGKCRQIYHINIFWYLGM